MTLVDEHVEKWLGWIEGPIFNDIIGMHHKRQIWRELFDMVEQNPAAARCNCAAIHAPNPAALSGSPAAQIRSGSGTP
jgi:hypothetical protein